MIIDLLLLSCVLYATYSLFMCFMDNDPSWAAYKPKHKKHLFPKRSR